MTRNEFIEMLQASLEGEIPSDKIYENVKYYSDYITQTASEEKTIDGLGDPRLIAKTIIDTYKLSKGPIYKNNEKGGFYKNSDGVEEYVNEDGSSEKNNDSSWNIHYHTLSKRPWYKKLLSIVIVLLVILVIMIVGGFALNIVFKIGIPIILIVLFVSMIGTLFKR